jgi:IMP dehydrogenase/GMP reductase
MSNRSEEIQKEIVEVERQIIESSQGCYPKSDIPKSIAFKKKGNFNHYLELKAKLEGIKIGEQKAQDVLKIIDERISSLRLKYKELEEYKPNMTDGEIELQRIHRSLIKAKYQELEQIKKEFGLK